MKKSILAASILLLAAACSKPQPVSVTSVPATPIVSSPAPAPTSTPVFTASTTSPSVISDQYGLFRTTNNDVQNSYQPQTKYLDDGIIGSGPFMGYHLLAGFISADDPSGGYTYFFATKDYNSYLLDSSTYPSYSNPVNDLKDSDPFFNTQKVVGIAALPSHFPLDISEGNFILERGQADWSAKISADKQLLATTVGLGLYSQPFAVQAAAQSQDAAYAQLLANENDYFSATTQVLAQDQAGLIYDYTLISKEEYSRESPQNGSDLNFYKKSELNSQSPLYDSYGQLFPGGCGQANLTYVLKNIAVGDLVKVATTNSGVDLYTLKDQNHPLNKSEYSSKVTVWADEFKDINKIDIPSYQNYVAKNPVLIFQDPWGRWVGLGEWQYITGGGCGKPVIYLYPQKPTVVTVKFLAPMHFNADLPSYSGQWHVLASPGGQLKDLQPQKTDCAGLSTNLPGLEYAADACQTGIYPYLYWSGQTTSVYPKADGGWVVKNQDVAGFLAAKLTEIGLNKKEQDDMLSYWVPALLEKNAPYYRLSFFQTGTMNKFIPMQIMPTPDTVFRIFLDWSPLSAPPESPLPPQKLTPINRSGFTVVEWGGLKQ